MSICQFMQSCAVYICKYKKDQENKNRDLFIIIKCHFSTMIALNFTKEKEFIFSLIVRITRRCMKCVNKQTVRVKFVRWFGSTLIFVMMLVVWHYTLGVSGSLSVPS